MSEDIPRMEFRWQGQDEANFSQNGRTPDSVAAASCALVRLNCKVSRECPLDYTLDYEAQAGSFACKLCQAGPARAAAAFEGARWRAGKHD